MKTVIFLAYWLICTIYIEVSIWDFHLTHGDRLAAGLFSYILAPFKLLWTLKNWLDAY